MGKPSKAAATAAKRIGKVAEAGTVEVRNPGGYHEHVTAVIGSDLIDVAVQDGVLMSFHTQPVGSVSRPEEDYFPGTYWSSMAAAIASCLPTQRAWVRNPHGLTGSLTVEVRRAGVALKPEAFVELSLETASYFYGSERLRRVKGGTLLALCQAVAATKGEDLAAVAALLDHLEEEHPKIARYMEDSRQWPGRRATTRPEDRPGYEAYMSS